MSAWSRRLGTAIENRLFGFVFDHLRSGDLGQAYRRGRRLAKIGPRLQRQDWSWTLKSLQLIFGPALDDAKTRRLALRVYENFFHTIAEGLHSNELRTTRSGFEKIVAAHEQGRGVIACGLHLGSWDVGLEQLAAIGIPTAVVYRPPRASSIGDRMQEMGATWGVRFIRQDDVWSMVRFLKQGHMLSILCDQTPRDPGVVASFLGVRARFPQGPARLALRLNALVVAGVHVRERPGEVKVHCESVIDPQQSRSTDKPLEDLTRKIAAAFEPWILDYAEQYNWSCPIWRQKPGGGMWGLDDPNETIRGDAAETHAPLSDRVRSLIA